MKKFSWFSLFYGGKNVSVLIEDKLTRAYYVKFPPAMLLLNFLACNAVTECFSLQCCYWIF